VRLFTGCRDRPSASTTLPMLRVQFSFSSLDQVSAAMLRHSLVGAFLALELDQFSKGSLPTDGKRKAPSPISALCMIPAYLVAKTSQNSLILTWHQGVGVTNMTPNLTVFLPKMTAKNLILAIHLFQRRGTFTGTCLDFLDI